MDKAAGTVPGPIAIPIAQPATTQLPSPPHSLGDHMTETKPSMDVPDNTTPPFSPSSQTPVLQKEQEEFEGTAHVNNDIPTEKDLSAVGDLLILDAQGKSTPFKDIYQAPHVASRQLIIFIRHFFCGNCQEYIRTLASSIKPDDLLKLPTPTSITVIGCGRPDLIPMYIETTGCPFPIYAEPTRKLYDHLGMTRTLTLGSKPQYMQTHVLINSVQSIFQGLSTGRKALKGGDFKQVGGEFLFEKGECTWAHRMKTTRGHAEVSELRNLIGLDGTRPPVRRKWSHHVKGQDKDRKRAMSWGLFRSKSKSTRDSSTEGSRGVTPPEKIAEEEPKQLMGRPTV
ncbi:TSA antioxidant enzyme-domain-containing [Pyrenophora seminiperda CCB06]|uniref:TSA antioxidant enzyme-domain-containing n=1 Tax=Pyrenophora seminiperda CCB06 TaxID=1302712 RepID=A0A3M7M7A5_9PLEO|nr:TSA antioxidant enzyme-domain-containing [Pyrenophora seminiperda CCB06]